MAHVRTGRVAILAERLYQELELWYPLLRLREAGLEAVVVGPEAREYTSKLGYPVQATVAAQAARASDFDAVITPGGYCPDYLRRNGALVALVADVAAAGGTVAAICHGPWLLCSAGVLRGRRATSHPAIRDDVTNAGATWVDAAVVSDGPVITSRAPDDLPVFCQAILARLTG